MAPIRDALPEPRHGVLATFDGLQLRTCGSSPTDPVPAFQFFDEGRLSAVVFGPLTRDEAVAVASAVASGRDPGGPDVPWFCVTRSGTQGIAASASTMLTSGFFWQASAGQLRIATDPMSAAGFSRELDQHYFADFLAQDIGPSRTPFRDVTRVPGGNTLQWTRPDTRAITHNWLDLEQNGKHELTGPTAREAYLAAFDTAISALVLRAGPLYSAMSGGLDSTFVVAALARSGHAVVQARTHVPLDAARLTDSGNTDASEWDLARLVADRYANRVDLRALSNDRLERPLHAADRAGARSGVPAFNPGNQVWLDDLRGQALAGRAKLLFVGGHGNAAFSHQHPYAASFLARRGNLGGLRRLASDDDGRWRLQLARRRIWAPLRRGRSRALHPLHECGIQAGATQREDRRSFLSWLGLQNRGNGAAANPAALDGLLLADPFTSRAVLQAAAAIAPDEWVTGSLSRAFARRAGAGRVPDEIRLRTRRGQQGRDAWWVIRHDREEYLARVKRVAAQPELSFVDVEALGRVVAAWPWGEVTGPAWIEQVAVDRLLSSAAFAEWAKNSWNR